MVWGCGKKDFFCPKMGAGMDNLSVTGQVRSMHTFRLILLQFYSPMRWETHTGRYSNWLRGVRPPRLTCVTLLPPVCFPPCSSPPPPHHPPAGDASHPTVLVSRWQVLRRFGRSCHCLGEVSGGWVGGHYGKPVLLRPCACSYNPFSQ